MLDLSVVVPTHNRLDLLPGLIYSLSKQDYPAARWELIIVDDGSTDGTPDWLNALRMSDAPRLTIIAQQQSGVAKARNNGAARARGRAVLFLDDDMIAAPALVAAHAAVHQGDPAAVVVGHLSMPGGVASPWVAWECAELARHYAALASGRRIPGPRDFYTGNCSVSRALFTSVGGFDPSLPRTEDVDLGYRLRGLGARFYYRAAAESLHLGTHTYPQWLRNARLYGVQDVVLGWEKGNHEVWSELFHWYNLRHQLNRALIRVCSAAPAASGPAIWTLHLIGRVAYGSGALKLSNACYSAIYNLAYWLAVEQRLGRKRFWRGVRAQRRRGQLPRLQPVAAPSGELGG